MPLLSISLQYFIYFMTIWSILWSFWSIFPRFGTLYREESGSPAHRLSLWSSTRFGPVLRASEGSERGWKAAKSSGGGHRSKINSVPSRYYSRRPIHTGWPDGTNFRRPGDLSTLGRVLKMTEIAEEIWLHFLPRKNVYVCFKNGSGYILGDLLPKLIWSPCSYTFFESRRHPPIPRCLRTMRSAGWPDWAIILHLGDFLGEFLGARRCFWHNKVA
jgi:hypothetical protein